MKSPKPPKSPKPARPPKRIPTKDEVLAYIRDNEGKTSRRDIARAFGVKGDDRTELRHLLRDLAEEGAIDKPKGRIEERGRLSGVMVLDVTEMDTDGELIGTPSQWSGEGKAPGIRIAPGRETKGPAIGVGERVLARVGRDEEGEPVARLLKRLGASAHEILGVLKTTKEGPRIQPVDRKVKGELSIGAGDLKGAREGDLVLAEMLPERGYGLKRARIKERMGAFDAPGAISLIAIHAHRLPTHFPESALDEARGAEPAVGLAGREDLRDIPFVTIDPEDARDHDDAVYAERDKDARNPGGFVVWVAIADVAHYVTPGSALDRAALKRGNSVYFPDRVVPMLPEELSADLCSLREREVRPALAVRMIFDKRGQKKAHRMVRGLMRSAARLTYRQAQEAWDSRPDEKTGPLLEPVLEPLFAAYRALAGARDERSPLDLDLPEHRIRFGADGRIAEVRLRERLETMRLIEEFMIQANVAAAEILEQKRLPLLYRVHEPPEQERLKAFAQFAESLDLRFAATQGVKPATFNKLLAAAKGTDYEPMLHEVILRTQAQARYAPEKLGHFGLNLRSYAHFTSPIRRYADLIVHRALIRALGLGDGGLTDAEIAALGDIGGDISALERRAMAAERDATDRYLAAYLSDRVGATFSGRISGVTRFGLFVRLDETGADGLVPIRSLGHDYFFHDEGAHALIGEVTGAVYRLGERVKVKLIEAAPITGGLVFELLSEPQTYADKKMRKGMRGRASERPPRRAKRAPKRSRKR